MQDHASLDGLRRVLGDLLLVHFIVRLSIVFPHGDRAREGDPSNVVYLTSSHNKSDAISFTNRDLDTVEVYLA